MQTAENKQLIEHIYAEVSKRNLGPLTESLTDDAVWTIIGTTELSGRFEGKEEIFERLLTPLAAALDGGVQFTIERLIAEGEYVVMQARGQATAKTGRPYNNTYCIIARIVNGRIREMIDYIDTELITSALFAP